MRDTYHAYSKLDDEALNAQVALITNDHPNIGFKSVQGHLLSRGGRVPEYRVRDSLRRVDPAGVLFRRSCMKVMHRKPYSVACLLSLWHIDGYHKLIR